MTVITDNSPLKFIGTGSAFNETLGNNSAYIKRDSTLILLDCGGTVFHRMQQLKLFEDIQNIYVIITHMHPDHIGSLGDLIFFTYYMLNSKTTLIYPDFNSLTSFLNHVGVTKDFYETQDISGSLTIETVHITLTLNPIPQEHTETLKSYGYILNFDNYCIFYSGDSYRISEGILNDLHLGKIHYFYQDTCGKDFPQNPHMYIGKLAQCIPPNLRHRIYCMHMDKSFDTQKAYNLGFNVVQPQQP